MRRHRTTAVLLGLVGLFAAAFANNASGRERGTVPRLIFPFVAKTVLSDNYGDPERAVKSLFAARQGSVFSLALHAQLVAAGAGAAALQVDHVRKYPGGRWLDVDPREVELTVPLGTDVEPFAQLNAATLRQLKKPAKVTAYTLKANATQSAIVGGPGELLLGRVTTAP